MLTFYDIRKRLLVETRGNIEERGNWKKTGYDKVNVSEREETTGEWDSDIAPIILWNLSIKLISKPRKGTYFC